MKTIIKLGIVISSLFISVNAFSKRDVCRGTYSQMEKEEGMAGYVKEVCRLDSKDGHYAIQVVKYVGKCQRWEDALERDCFFVRECGGNYTELRTSPSVYDKKSFIEGICKEDGKKFDLLSSDILGNSGVFAESFISCDSSNKEKKEITLKIDGRIKTCSFPLSP